MITQVYIFSSNILACVRLLSINVSSFLMKWLLFIWKYSTPKPIKSLPSGSYKQDFSKFRVLLCMCDRRTDTSDFDDSDQNVIRSGHLRLVRASYMTTTLLVKKQREKMKNYSKHNLCPTHTMVIQIMQMTKTAVIKKMQKLWGRQAVKKTQKKHPRWIWR